MTDKIIPDGREYGDRNRLDAYILERLSAGEDPNDLILELCERTGMAWPEMQALVDGIRMKESALITRKQSPVLVAMALAMFLAGSGFIVFEASTLLRIASSLWRYYTRAEVDPFVVLDLISLLPANAIPALEFTPVAVAMILGSLVGMREVWAAILFPPKDGPDEPAR